LLNDGFEILKRAWLYVRTNRGLWPFAFVIALTGGGSAGFSLWVQSPIPRGLTGLSPIHQLGARITEYAHGNVAFWALFIVISALLGLLALAAGAFSQAAAIGSVSEIDRGAPMRFRDAFEWGRSNFMRLFLLVLAYVLVLLVFAAPSYLFWWTVGRKGTIMPCLGALVLGIGFAVVVTVMSMIYELAARFLVLDNKGIVESVRLAGIMLKDYWRDVAMTWLYVLVITIMGTITMAILIALLSVPLAPVVNLTRNHHNAFLIALSMLVFLLAWAVASAAAGLFSITASAVWTLAFNDLR
jgi:hypothetical protein